MEQFYQTRAIVGSGEHARHFVAISEDNPTIFAQPGCDVVAEEIISGNACRVFKHRTITLEQLQAWAESMGERVVVNSKYPLIRMKKDGVNEH